MPFPGWSSTVVQGDLVTPQPDRPTPINECREYGPVDVADLSEGLLDNTWRCYWDGGSIYIKNVTTDDTPIALVAAPLCDHVSLTFDQQARPVVAYISVERCYLYWYDPIAVDYVHTLLADPASTCFISMPDRRQIQIDLGQTEVVLVYQVDNTGGFGVHSAKMRLQSERFETEHDTDLTDVAGLKLSNLAMNNVMRLQVNYEL